jgi:hypothetical protein
MFEIASASREVGGATSVFRRPNVEMATEMDRSLLQCCALNSAGSKLAD